MNISEFNNILDYAIEKEQEAVNFYIELQNKTEFSELKKMLVDLENMERGHITVIENLRKKGISQEVIKDLPALKLSENLEEPQHYHNLNYTDIIIIAMKREENAYNLYSAMIDHVSDTELKNLFRKLANEEQQHKIRFEKLYQEVVLKDN